MVLAYKGQTQVGIMDATIDLRAANVHRER